MHLIHHTESHEEEPAEGWSRFEFWALVTLTLFSLVVGTIGYMNAVDDQRRAWGFWDALYDSMRLFEMHFDRAPQDMTWQLQTARFLAPLLTIGAVVKGFLFATRRRGRALLHRSKKGHVVICGLNRRGLEWARQLRELDRDCWVTIVEKNPRNPLIPICEREGIFCQIGDATEAAVLEDARVAQAQDVIIITPEDETNLRIAMQVREVTEGKALMQVGCYVQIENIHLRERLQRLFGSDVGKLDCTLRFFDVYDAEARRILLELPLDGAGIAPGDPREVHVAILGFGRMGRSLAVRAAKLGHFANGRKLRISVIDRYPDRQRERFFFRFPAMAEDEICKITFHHAEAESLTTRKMIEYWAADPNSLLHVFICLDDDACAVEVALRLQEMLDRRTNCNLCVRIKTRTSMTRLFDAAPPDAPPLRAFGMVADVSYCDVVRPGDGEKLAHMTHNAFREKRLKDSDRRPSNDPAMQFWDDLTEDLRESNRTQTDHIAIKMRAIGCDVVPESDSSPAVTNFSEEETDLLSQLEHRRWIAERLLTGWRYGPVTDKPHRINQNLVEWDRLTTEVKRYDIEAVDEIPKRLAAGAEPKKVVRRNIA